MKVVIIGAGFAGSIASGAFAADGPINYDQSAATDEPKHKAVMRLRDANVAKYLGTHVEPVTVWKSVAWDGQLYEVADMRMSNQYSLKLYGELGERSLRSLGRVERWLMAGVPRPYITHWDHKLVSVTDGHLVFEVKVTDKLASIAESQSYDICISTIPMPILLKAAGIKFDEKFECRPIWVWTGTLIHHSSLHQTIYFSDDTTPVYRATIQGRKVIIESIDDSKINIDEIIWHFGLWTEDLQTLPNRAPEDEVKLEMFKQPMGKMIAIDEDARRQYIYELTDRFGIYSFGRYAIWKPIRTDHLVQDIDKIMRLAKLSHTVVDYRRSKARTP